MLQGEESEGVEELKSPSKPKGWDLGSKVCGKESTRRFFGLPEITGPISSTFKLKTRVPSVGRKINDSRQPDSEHDRACVIRWEEAEMEGSEGGRRMGWDEREGGSVGSDACGKQSTRIFHTACFSTMFKRASVFFSGCQGRLGTFLGVKFTPRFVDH